MKSIPFPDSLFFKIQPHFLYRTKKLQNIADISVSLLHRDSPVEKIWKFMDYLVIKKYSLMEYKGTVKQLKMLGELDPKALIFEVIKANSERTVNPGDIVLVDKKDLTYFADAPHV